MTITEQARAAAEAIAEYNGSYSELRHTPESVIAAYERIIIKHVHPASLTDAIEAVKRLRNKWESEDADFVFISVANEIITTLRALEGKPSEVEKHIADLNHDLQASIDYCNEHHREE